MNQYALFVTRFTLTDVDVNLGALKQSVWEAGWEELHARQLEPAPHATAHIDIDHETRQAAFSIKVIPTPDATYNEWSPNITNTLETVK